MKTSSFISACALALSVASARQMHAEIDYERYLAEKDQAQADLDAWSAKYEKIATERGIMPTFESRDLDEVNEDKCQRLHAAKEASERALAANPNGNFSTDSIYSIMTNDEFKKMIRNKHVQGGKPNAQQTSAPSRLLREQSEQPQSQSYSFSSFQDMWNSLVKKMQDQMKSNGSGNQVAQWSSTSSDTPCPEEASKTAAPQTPAPTSAPTPTTPAPTTPKPTTKAPVVQPTTSKPSTPVATEKGAAGGSGYAVDWSATKCMSPVQSQGQCGSCWAFASTAAVETLECTKNGWSRPNKFSEQSLVGCDTQNFGCGGGAPVYAFEYIQQNGLCAESDLPYQMSNGGTASCSNSCKKYGTGITGFDKLDSGDEGGLIEALKSQPVVVSVASGNDAWKQYTGGVMSYCETTELDHAVLVVGYDDNVLKVRNSWGDYWGEDGYVRMKRSSGTGTCGLLQDMSHPKI